MTRRFFKSASVVEGEAGYAVVLDQREVRTPMKTRLVLPTLPLAEAIAAEWNDQRETIDQTTMPQMRLACTALDTVAADPAAVADAVAAYVGTELLCYRADAPEKLVARQAQHWQPVLDWAAARYGVEFVVTTGVLPVEQPAETADHLRAAIRALDAFRLTGLQALAMDLGSLVLALAVLEAHLPPREAHALSQLDELYQSEVWGVDEEAADRRSQILAEVEADGAFLRALEG